MDTEEKKFAQLIYKRNWLDQVYYSLLFVVYLAALPVAQTTGLYRLIMCYDD
jgi:hypothetical protein